MFEQSPRADERKFDAPSARSRPPSKIKTRFFFVLAFAYIPSAATTWTNYLPSCARGEKEFSSGIRIENSWERYHRLICDSANVIVRWILHAFPRKYSGKSWLPSMSSPWRNDGILWPTSIFSSPLSDGILRTSEINFERDDVNLTTKIKYEDEIIETR